MMFWLKWFMQKKRSFLCRTDGEFFQKNTFSLGQVYLRAGYVEARNGWYQKATQIEAKFDSWISWCTAMSVKGCAEALNPKKPMGGSLVKVCQYPINNEGFGLRNGMKIPTIGMNMKCSPSGKWVSHARWRQQSFLEERIGDGPVVSFSHLRTKCCWQYVICSTPDFSNF